MKKNLIIILSDYPFNNGEPFIINEIEYLSNSFDNIYLFSVCGKKGIKPIYKLKENVHAYPLNCNHNKIKYVLQGLFYSNKYFKIEKRGFKKNIADFYLRGRNKTIVKSIKRYIDPFINYNDSFYVYTYWLTFAISGILLKEHLLKKFQIFARVISRCHRYDIYNEEAFNSYIPFQSESIKLLDGVYSCSNDGANYLSKLYPDFSTKISTLRLCTNDNCTSLSYGKQNCYRFVTVAGFRKVKRLDLFALAFIDLVKSHSNVFWDAFGDGEDLCQVKTIIENANCSGHVRFHGNVTNKEIFEFYRNNEVFYFVNVSSSEGIPVSIMEAMSFGIPCIATNVGGTSEIVNNSNGVLIDASIVSKDLCTLLSNLITLDFKKYIDKRKEARNTWESLYNPKNNLPRVYNSIIGDKTFIDEISALIMTCDNNLDILSQIKNNCYLLESCGIKPFLSVETKMNEYKNFNFFSSNSSFSERMLESLKHLKSKYVLLLLDDHLIYETSFKTKIGHYMKEMEENNIDVLRISKNTHIFVCKTKLNCNLYYYKKLYPYDIDLHPTIWKKDVLVKYLQNKKDNPWKLESRLHTFLTSYNCCYTKDYILYKELIIKGKLVKKAYKFQPSYNGNRKTLTNNQYFRYKLKKMIRDFTPYCIIKLIVNIFKINSLSGGNNDY